MLGNALQQPFRVFFDLLELVTQLFLDGLWKRFERQQGFLIGGLTPFLLTALMLTTAYAWYRNGGGRLDELTVLGLDSRGTFVLAGAVMHGIGWLTAAVLLRRWQRVTRWTAVELLVILWSGALGGLLLWSVLAETPSDIPVSAFPEWYAVFSLAGFLTMFLLTATIFVGVASRYTDDHDREWWGRAGAWGLIASVSWTGLSALVAFGPGLAGLSKARRLAGCGGKVAVTEATASPLAQNKLLAVLGEIGDQLPFFGIPLLRRP